MPAQVLNPQAKSRGRTRRVRPQSLPLGVNKATGVLAIGKPLTFMYNAAIRKRGRVVEGTSLEN